LGISTVYQEINLCANLTVAENILIGREPTNLAHRLGKMNAEAGETP
jgi:galactofuranose transport system ATP-binding protein